MQSREDDEHDMIMMIIIAVIMMITLWLLHYPFIYVWSIALIIIMKIILWQYE